MPLTAEPGVDHVIHDRDSLPAHVRMQRARKAIAERIERVRAGRVVALRVGEGHSEPARDHQREERALDERPAHDIDRDPREAVRQLVRERLDARRLEEQRLEIHPQIAVMPRLQEEVSALRREEGHHAVVHRKIVAFGA